MVRFIEVDINEWIDGKKQVVKKDLFE